MNSINSKTEDGDPYNLPHAEKITKLDDDSTYSIEKLDLLFKAKGSIKTKGLFNFMDLPTELRLKIYPHLLRCDEDITVNSAKEANSMDIATTTPRPFVAILQTCKLINQEGTPILYGQNRFIIYLSMEPSPSFSLSNSFILRSLRWSTIALLTSLSFHSTSTPLPGIDGLHTESSSSRPSFNCTGANILSRFSPADFRYSPKGPDEYMALSVSNWVSTQVMRVMLSAFQKELEMMMRTSATDFGDPNFGDADADPGNGGGNAATANMVAGAASGV